MKEYTNSSGQLHREDGPAIEYHNGNKHWYINGLRHRTDGPACEDSDGSKVWYINGQLHRTDGPAYEDSNGDKEWWLNGERVYSDNMNNLSQYDVSEPFKRSIVKYELSR